MTTQQQEQVFTGKVVSARYSDYLTNKYGNEDTGLTGYTIHVLVDQINGESIAKHCFELQCYADYVGVNTNVDQESEITYLHLVSPIFINKDGTRACDCDVAVGETYINFKGFNFKRKIKNEKEYRMLRTGLPMCSIRRPLITACWLNEIEEPVPFNKSSAEVEQNLEQQLYSENVNIKSITLPKELVLQ